MSDEVKIVCDTQIFLRALINPKSLSGKLAFDLKTNYKLYTTDLINKEVEEVLGRPAIRTKFPQITDERVNMIHIILSLANFVEVNPEDILPVSRDPKDDIFLACAKAANADYLVTEDNDLLVLGSYAGTAIVSVLAFLAILEKRREDNTNPPT